MRYWTSDLHFGHANVILYCKRPFGNTYEMNQGLIDRWNSVVTPDDDVVFLGDWSMHQKYYIIMTKLNFKSLLFVAGNHDKKSKLIKMIAEFPEMQHLASKVTIVDEAVVDIQGKQFHCVHRPITARDDMPTICGHVHTAWTTQPVGAVLLEHNRDHRGQTKTTVQPILNVGCDVHNYYPISDDQVLEYFRS